MLSSQNTQADCRLPLMGDKEKAHPIKVIYTNYRGETAVRTIIPLRFFFGSTEYHTEEQWLLELWDVEKDALRVYALKDIQWASR